jgi:Sulfotransferase family
MGAPFPFLVGSGRSGTTLTRAMLDSHPDVAVPPETYFITELLPNVPRYEEGGGFALAAFLDDILENQWFRRWELDPDSVREALRSNRPSDYPEAIRAIFRQYASAHGKSRYGDKTPVYVYDMGVVGELFPEARFAHVIRDGRDVAASFLDQQEMRPNGVAEAALLWKERVSAGRSAGAALGPERYIEIRYEDLVRDPESTLRRLCAFIELDYRPAMLSYPERAGELVARDGGPQQHRGIFLEPRTGLRDWRTELSSAEIEAFEVIAGELLAELGYERHSDTDWTGDHPSVGVLVSEVERLRGEVVTVERDLRTRIRALRRKLRRASS